MSRTKPLENHPRYKEIKPLNKGTFGSVYLALDQKTGRQVAIKFLSRGPGVTSYVERELATHRMMNHAHVIKLREVFLTRYHLGIVLEYADGGDCYDYVVSRRRLSENKARWIFQQLVIAIDYQHLMKVANRDIKLENTLICGDVDKPLVKICDLGYAKSEELHSIPDSKVGTPAYLAPEVISCSTYNGFKADIWSMGVMLYVMLVGQYPFERPTDKALSATRKQQVMIDRILRADYAIPENVIVSPECKDLLSKMLTIDPEARITMPQIMEHPWYQMYLPAGVTDMNKHLTPNQTSQSAEELKRIVREGMQIGSANDKPATNGRTDNRYDDFVDEATRV